MTVTPPGGMGARPADGEPYSEGERVFAPPVGTLDLEWAARLLREREPLVPWPAALAAVTRAWDALRASPALDAAGLAARLQVAPGDPDPLLAAAAVVVDLARAYDAL